MDTITHGLSGTLVGYAARDKFKKIPPKLLVYFFTFSTIFPDFDILFRLVSEQSYLNNHRGITHSIILLPLWGILLSLFFVSILKYKIFLKKHTEEIPAINIKTFIELYIISIFGIIFHIAADLITTYGTMILLPIDNQKFAYGSVFIIDLIFTGIIVVGILFSHFCRKYSKSPQIAQIFTILLIAYVGTTQVLKINALEKAKLNFDLESNEQYYSFTILPQPLSPFKWKVYAYHSSTEVFYSTTLNLLDKTETPTWDYAPKWGTNPDWQPLAKMAWKDNNFAQIRHFFALPAFHSIQENEGSVCLFFQDLRFSNKYVSNPFVYGLCSHESGLKTIQKLSKL